MYKSRAQSRRDRNGWALVGVFLVCTGWFLAALAAHAGFTPETDSFVRLVTAVLGGMSAGGAVLALFAGFCGWLN